MSERVGLTCRNHRDASPCRGPEVVVLMSRSVMGNHEDVTRQISVICQDVALLTELGISWKENS